MSEAESEEGTAPPKGESEEKGTGVSRWQKVLALSMSLMMVMAGLPMPTGSAFAQLSSAKQGAEPEAASAQQAYKQAIDRIDRMMAALDVVDRKVDRSLFEIEALAGRLGPDPGAMFRFVRGETRYEPYYGVLRGARGVLIGRAGNSLDCSLLLAALLQKAGFATQVAAGHLNEKQARALVDRLFEPARPTPSSLPAVADLTPDIARALGVKPEEMTAITESLKARQEKADEALWDRVEGETGFLSNILAKAGADLGGLTSYDRLVAEAQEHYWVRYQDSTGQWIDLDPAFADAEPGKAMTTATESFAPDAVPEDRYHRLGIKVTLRVAEVAGKTDGLSTDTVLIDQDFQVADRQGVGISLTNLPLPSLDELLKPGVVLTDVLARIQEYLTVLRVGDQLVVGKFFDLKGQLYNSAPGSPERIGELSGKGFGGAGSVLGGLADRISGKQAAPTGAKTTRIVGQWVDYRLTSPGARSEAPTVRNFRRDIVAPDMVTGWSADGPSGGTTVPTTLSQDDLRRRLLWSVELLPVTGRVVPDYLGYLQLATLRGSRSLIESFTRRVLGLPADTTTMQPPPSYPIMTLLLATSAMENTRTVNRTRFPGLEVYSDRPGLIAYERMATTGLEGNTRFIEGYDIVASAPRVVGRQTDDPDQGRQAVASFRTLRGVLETRLEWALMAERVSVTAPEGAQPPVVRNMTEVFQAAHEQGVSMVVLKPGADGLQQLAGLMLPAVVKAELSTSLSNGHILVVPVREVTFDRRPQVGWWRVDRASGESIGIMEGGRGEAEIEYGMVVNAIISFYGAWVTFAMCIWGLQGSPNIEEKVIGCLVVGAASGVGSFSYFPPAVSPISFIIAIIASAFLLRP